MRVLIDIGHPAHVHLFRNFAHDMISSGHEILFTCREKEFEIDLLSHYKLPFESLGKKPGSVTGKLTGLVKFDCKLYSVAKKFKPDLFLSHGSYYAAHVAFLTNKPHIAFEDTFNFEQVWLYKPFSKVILTADYDHPLKSKKVISFSGYHELAYLHPKRFTPNKSIFKKLGLEENDKYVIIRFVSWKASHDIGHKGISYDSKIKAIKEFSRFARVFISSEADLPEELNQFKIRISPHYMHDALAYASLVWAESFTMPAEGAVLGTPSIVIHNTKSLYLDELSKKYGLCFIYSESEQDQISAIKKGMSLLEDNELKTEWALRRDRMFEDKIDVTSFIVWFIENWPESFRIMKEDPGYQERFK
ncbi:MAG TPA: DUF354 domain-containing protein [Bacteroidales bacterium]|nr:DUF354 domain-containing protein [Bacteroidales bacterium]HNR40725.1 DUF354 domain-containing protein [Bacteroidales bacterium]